MLRAAGLKRSIAGRVLFADLDLHVAAGQRVLLRAPSGRGKTVLLRALAALDVVQQGVVTLESRTAEQWGFPAWRAQVAYVPARPPPMDQSCEQMAHALGALRALRGRFSAQTARSLAETFGLGADQWTSPLRTLSAGEQSRAHLALALASQPKVLLLDEPTSALDPDAIARVEETLRSYTAVVASHDAAQAARLDATVWEPFA